MTDRLNTLLFCVKNGQASCIEYKDLDFDGHKRLLGHFTPDKVHIIVPITDEGEGFLIFTKKFFNKRRDLFGPDGKFLENSEFVRARFGH